MLTSDQLLVFLSIMREGNTVGAARRLGLDHSTVSRRLSALERALGTRLFDRSPRGLAPTPAATALIGHAERVESELLLATASVGQRDTRVSGTVRLATPEIFGTYLVAPHVAELRTRHPGLTLELVPETRTVSLSKREADIAITIRQPPRGRLVGRKLVDYRLGLYAARDYLDRRPAITSRADLNAHDFVSYVDELLDFPELLSLNQAKVGGSTVFRSSSSAAQQSAVAAGAGIGMLHLLCAADDDRIERVLPDEIEDRRTYWMVLHADLQRVPRIRAVIDFLDDLVHRLQSRF
ncbi:LysR family transcriptional regulator [Novosphingobium sp. CECT 9465]|uniref:LysR family transcriptional regulator n=1 Tax=Novosphingobium sp. CECT 9465 TaxID=2829794 RepID=UPI001E57DEA7|nr:LysR family transcriptional regulator [Novosphingobium sp. CECT 9465]